MAGKKWCEYCRINIAYSKKDIQDHEATRTHLQNKQKAIQFQRMKVRKEKQYKKRTQHQVMLGTANIPKAKKGSELEKQVQDHRDAVILEGKSAIHRMIAQRTQGMFGAPIDYPDKEDLVLAENYKQDEQDDSQNQGNFQMWKIDICETTGQPCFTNKITKLILYEPPKGYVLSEQQKQEWEYLKEICKDKVQINPDATVNISQWQEVPDEQNYFQVNRAESSEQDDSGSVEPRKDEQKNTTDYSKYLPTKQQKNEVQNINEKPRIKTWKQDLEQKLMNNEISTNQVFQRFIQHQMKNARSAKQKNDNLKKLIQSGIQVRTRPTDQLISDEILGGCKMQQKPKVSFKPRKKVNLSANNVQLNQEKDIF